jgi:hypothetical protein
VKFAFIAKHRGIWAVDWMCGALGVGYGGLGVTWPPRTRWRAFARAMRPHGGPFLPISEWRLGSVRMSRA